MRILAVLFASLLTAAPLALAAAQARDPATPEQRIDRLERQLRQVQKSVFPKGQPADTAGIIDAPAATQEAVTALTGRLDAIERQMTDLVRGSEENTHRLGVMEADLARLRADNDQRFKAIQAVPANATTPAIDATPATTQGATPAAIPSSGSGPGPGAAIASDLPSAAADLPAKPPVKAPPTRGPTAPIVVADPGEAAYTAGFDLWSAKKFDQAITQLRAMSAGFPGHRRVSWANNLVGRALLDEGQPRAAAEALLANYRSNPKGERAPDSLFYLGQSLVKLGQPAQACKAYAELADVYRTTLRPQLAALLPAAKAQAACK